MDYQITAFHIVCVIGGFLSVSIGLTLIFMKSIVKQQNIFLGLFLLSVSLFFIPTALDTFNLLVKVPHLIRLNFLSPMLIGPFVYFYFKSATYKEAFIFKKHVFHFIPFILGIIYFWPWFMLSGEEKIYFHQKIVTEGFTNEHPIMFVLKTVLILFYNYVCYKITLNYIRQNNKIRSSINLAFYRWLIFLNISMILPVIILNIFSFTGNTFLTILSVFLSLTFVVIIIYFAYLFRPDFFHSQSNKIIEETPIIEEIPALEYISEKEELSVKKDFASTEIGGIKYQKSKLQEDQKAVYLEKILNYMDSQKPYLNPELTLMELSEQVNLPFIYVSQIINEKLEFNFLDFINKYRIEEIKIKLVDAKLSHYTIMALAYEAGFNSKTAFYSAFKKFVGISPSEYRSQKIDILDVASK